MIRKRNILRNDYYQVNTVMMTKYAINLLVNSRCKFRTSQGLYAPFQREFDIGKKCHDFCETVNHNMTDSISKRM
ncbi:hypothetical protein RCL_jg19562.t1 [Rhizophagus clarus]|uniref:Uncharacterized protein n=1 Tax=Rhizophagus clarus TaxID=94130 RepID=A0A8H3LE94_9GLOM|nr:hypothetical protein RCL_jg19562.t1 [Rhizophagus clarus]